MLTSTSTPLFQTYNKVDPILETLRINPYLFCSVRLGSTCPDPDCAVGPPSSSITRLVKHSPDTQSSEALPVHHAGVDAAGHSALSGHFIPPSALFPGCPTRAQQTKSQAPRPEVRPDQLHHPGPVPGGGEGAAAQALPSLQR